MGTAVPHALSDEAPSAAAIDVSLSGGLGYRHGIANEYVYEPTTGQMVSELNWEHDMALLNGRVDVSFFERWSLGLAGWTHIADSSLMKDRDWFFPGLDWSEYSIHPETRTDHAFGLDARLGYTVFERDGLSLTPLAGWRYQNMKWTALGGSYTYSALGYRDDIGSFPNGQKVISYEQWMSTPYIGASIGYAWNEWKVEGTLIGSPFAKFEDQDHHWLRDLVFDEYLDDASYLAARLDATYRLTERLSLGASIEYENYFETRGSMAGFSISDGSLQLVAPGDSAGASYEAFTVGMNVTGRF